MRSRARRFAARRHPELRRPPVTRTGATDELPGLGRVEQLVLRGDGLTTTSLEILTGERIDVIVDGHWHLTVSDTDERLPGGTMNFDLDGPDVDGYLATGLTDLAARVGDVLLVREVLLVGQSGTVHGSAEVVALAAELPEPVSEALATTSQPIGRLLRDHGVPVSRALKRWGFTRAGRQAARLEPGLVPTSKVLGRTYVMTLLGSGHAIAALTERFSPHVFQPPPG